METFRGLITTLVPVLSLCVALAPPAHAALKAVGPLDTMTTLPAFYQDLGGLALQPCLDQNGFCILPPPFDPLTSVPLSPITTTGPITNTNFPAEGFYYSAGALMNIEGGEKARLDYVLEYAFLSGVGATLGQTFLRTDLAKMSRGLLTPNSTYRVTHPYGSFTFNSDGAGNSINNGPNGVTVRLEDQVGVAADYFPPLFQSAPNTNIGPFLKRADGVFPTAVVNGATHTYIGDAVTPVPIVGGPNGNVFTIDRINPSTGAVLATWSTNLWTLAGRVFTDPIASPMTINRASYARDAASQQVDVFVTAERLAQLSISGTGLAATPLAEDVPNTGKFFVTIPVAALPTGVSITNSLDLPPIPHPVVLVDEVNISQAYYNPNAKTLTVRAASRDKLAPLPALSVPSFAAPNTLDATGTVTLPLPLNTIPPQSITVSSSKGGTASLPVSVLVPPPAPIAVDDAASTAAATAVTIDVLLNDTSAAALDATSVTIVASSPDGSTVVSPAGAVIFTPALGFSGAASFTYSVKDIYGQTSNAATVTVTVAPSAAPVAFADAASTTSDTPATIAVLANDVGAGINPASVAIATPSANGTAVANLNGTITFTPAAGFVGSTSFAYTVANSATPPLTSNAATVTVTVSAPAAPPAPVAVADSASTLSGTAVGVPVLANDTIAAPGAIDAASVQISTQSLNGAAAANLNGTVTFTPAAGFTGTTSFAYTVANTSVPALRSNAATVTVTVTAPAPAPVANNDTATTTAGTAVTTSVLANDTIGAPGVINTASVQIATPSANGTAVVNGTGTVTFTPAAGFTGTTSYTYTVANTSTPPLRSNAATVTVTVNAAAAQTIAVSRAQFTLSSAAWRIDGTVTPTPPAGTTLTVYNSALVGGGPVLIGSLSVANNGSFTWSSPNGAPQPNAARRISIQSNQNPATKLENITVTVR